MRSEEWKCRCSPSVITFQKRINRYWGLENWDLGKKEPVVFFGLYTSGDYSIFEGHKGEKIVFWCGGDIIQLLTTQRFRMTVWGFPKAKHFVENVLEWKELKEIGIKAEIKPSFLGDINKWKVSFKPNNRLQVFSTAHPSREEEYGGVVIDRVASKLPDVDFHIYGVEGENRSNIIFHGDIPEKQYDEEIKNYHCGLRPNLHDGFSETLAKSVLMAQYPISRIPYEKIWNYQTEEELICLLKKLQKIKKPNTEAREYWKARVNQFPFL